ncbi:hypothetical protein [Caminibacter sp.]
MVVSGKILDIQETKKGYIHIVKVKDGSVCRVYSRNNGKAVGDEIFFNVKLSLNDLYFSAENFAGKNK